MRIRLFLVVLVMSAAGAGAQDLGNFEKILIPVVVSPAVDGANGDVFSTEVLTMLPDSGVRMFPIYSTFAGTPRIGTGSGLVRGLFALSTPSRSGRLLFIERGASQQAVIQATLHTNNPAVIGAVSSAVTQPVARERDFRIDQTRIIGIASRYVPGEATCPGTSIAVYRHRLRIYDVDGGRNAQVIVRRFDPVSNPPFLLSEELVTLAYRDADDASYPSYAEITIPEVCHPFSCPTPCRGGPQYVEITPVTPGLRFWAMVSATNNFTHQVTLFYPQ